MGAEVQDSEIELKVRESHPEYSSFNINADTQVREPQYDVHVFLRSGDALL